MKKINLKDLDIRELEHFFEQIGERKFRAKQVFAWLYRGAKSFREMTDLSKTLQDKLCALEEAGEITLNCLELVKVQKSEADNTRKYLFRLADGNTVESVFMKYKYGNSICVSSQVGCRMGCKFCASTIGGLVRNLSPGEMVDQLICAERDTGEKINHIVVMGTGEPFDNYANLSKFLRLVNAEQGVGIGMRNISVSTCGLIPKIERFGDDFPQVTLAISLHAVNDTLRSEMMPINNKYPIEALIDVCKSYTKKTGRRVTFEYVLIKGVNDKLIHAQALAKHLAGMICHVNLIPLNKVHGTDLDSTGKKTGNAFMECLEKRGISVTVRRELGGDIDAACGQLRLGGK